MKERERELIVSGISLGILAHVLLSAFSKATRKEIYNRVQSRYGRLQSERSGRTGEPLECAHIDHDPQSPKYDRASNGRLLTLTEHLEDHLNREGRNGLTIEQNRWAIAELRNRIERHRHGSDDKNAVEVIDDCRNFK